MAILGRRKSPSGQRKLGSDLNGKFTIAVTALPDFGAGSHINTLDLVLYVARVVRFKIPQVRHWLAIAVDHWPRRHFIVPIRQSRGTTAAEEKRFTFLKLIFRQNTPLRQQIESHFIDIDGPTASNRVVNNHSKLAITWQRHTACISRELSAAVPAARDEYVADSFFMGPQAAQR